MRGKSCGLLLFIFSQRIGNADLVKQELKALGEGKGGCAAG